MIGWNSGPDGAGDNMHIMGGGNRRFGRGPGMGMGGRVRGPVMQAWQQHYQGQPRSQMFSDMRAWRQSEPVQAWAGQRPQPPSGGWGSPQAFRDAYIPWFNQMPDLPWGPAPDWPTPQTPPQTPPGGGQGGNGQGDWWQNIPWNNMPQNGAAGFLRALMGGIGQQGGQGNWLQILRDRFGG